MSKVRKLTVLTGGQYSYHKGLFHKGKTIDWIHEEEDGVYYLYDEDNVLISVVKSNSVEVEYE